MKQRHLSLSLLALAGIFFLFSCSKKETEPAPPQNSFAGYYPTAIGKYVVYEVDSTIYDDFLAVELHRSYQMRYDMVDTFRDAENRLSYVINTSIRNDDTSNWRVGEVLYVTPTDKRLEVVQQNLRFIKLLSPVANGISWKGNGLIATADQDYQYFADWDYTYENVGQPYNNGRLEFEHSLTVQQEDYSLNLPYDASTQYAVRTFGKEVYASKAGLVYKELTHYVLDRSLSGFPKGYSVVMRAIDYN